MCARERDLRKLIITFFFSQMKLSSSQSGSSFDIESIQKILKMKATLPPPSPSSSFYSSTASIYHSSAELPWSDCLVDSWIDRESRFAFVDLSAGPVSWGSKWDPATGKQVTSRSHVPTVPYFINASNFDGVTLSSVTMQIEYNQRSWKKHCDPRLSELSGREEEKENMKETKGWREVHEQREREREREKEKGMLSPKKNGINQKRKRNNVDDDEREKKELNAWCWELEKELFRLASLQSVIGSAEGRKRVREEKEKNEKKERTKIEKEKLAEGILEGEKKGKVENFKESSRKDNGVLTFIFIYVYMCMLTFTFIFMFVCVCLDSRLFMFAFVYAFIHVYLCLYVHVYVCMHVCLCMYVYVCLCMYVYVCMHMYVCICMFICMHMYV